MIKNSMDALITEAPGGRHFCQFHRDPDALTGSVAAFANAGLTRGDAVVLVAVPGRTAEVVDHLGTAGADPEAAVAAGQLVLLDAETLLARFMDGDSPDWGAFREAVGGVLDDVRVAGFRRVRAYGEMVNVLWRDGNPDAAVRLEELWNRLAREYRFCLFCGYELDGLDLAAYSGPLHEVGRVHSDFPQSSDDERLVAAIDAATRDVFGAPLSTMLTHTGDGHRDGEQCLPAAQRIVLWLQRHMPHAVGRVLTRARAHYDALA